jgi:hypothetical protein
VEPPRSATDIAAPESPSIPTEATRRIRARSGSADLRVYRGGRHSSRTPSVDTAILVCSHR